MWSPERKQLHNRVQAPHATRERESVLSALERRDVPLQRLPGGLRAARVFVPLVPAESVLYKGGSLVDRGHDGAGHRVRPLAGVDRARREPRY